MKKLGAALGALLLLGGLAVPALAAPGGGATPGQGKDATCTDGSSCPSPTDPTAADANRLPANPAGAYVGAEGDPATRTGGVAVALGDEGQANSVGRASLSSDGSGLQIYAEDYTDGNQIAGVVTAVNNATGCQLIAPPEGTQCGDNTGDDAVLVDIHG